MKKSKLTIVLYIYFFLCIIHSSYAFYKMGKNFFYPETEKQIQPEHKVTSTEKVTSQSSENTQPKHIARTELTQVKFNFLKNCEFYPISKDIEMNNQDFNMYKKEYNYYLNRYFTHNQLKGLEGIIIADAEMFEDGSAGVTESLNGISYITLAARNGDSTCIIHETCHAMQAKYIDVFNIYYKKRWEKCNKFVSDYAKTNIFEDFAETGTAYLIGDTSSNNPKFKIFAEFYNRIK
ncbi:MAG: hypothetical protein E6R13_08010 [Spirochaetes bacterium]|nr:MAG: hypothetical protein E6R13_08010 [Spirochaetota bacterium]